MKSFATMPCSRLIIAVFLCLSSSVLQAEIYRWVDANGVTNYSDQPIDKKKKARNGVEILEFTVPKKAKVEEKEVSAEGVEQAKPEMKDSKALLTESAIKQAFKQESKRGNKEDKCRVLRRQLAALEEKDFATYRDEQGNYRVSWGDDGVYKGKREYLSRSEINKQTVEINSQIKQACDQSDDDDAMQSDVRADWIRSEHCALNKAILTDLKKPDLRTANRTLLDQEKVVERYCDELEAGKYRDDENYYPKSFPARGRIQNASK